MTATATPPTGQWTPRRIAVWTAVALLGALAGASWPWPGASRSTRCG